jgi:rare lipoprotein A (peptidoglycan hydrolase)
MRGYAACVRRRSGVLLIAGVAAALLVPSAQAATGGASAVPAESELGSVVSFGGMRTAGATWYGPGFYGHRTACGVTLRPGTLGVAHRSLPCGTAVKFVYHGRVLVTRVIDRGPYSSGNSWDLTSAASRALGFSGSGKIHYAVARR